MKRLTAMLGMLGAIAAVLPAQGQVRAEVEACRKEAEASIKSRSPSLEALTLELDGMTIAEADTKVGAIPVRLVVMGEAYLKRDREEKPHSFLCLVGDRGAVLMTFLTVR